VGRAIRIGLRPLPIGAVAMVLGAVAFGGNAGSWWSLLVLSGGGIIASDLYKHGIDWFGYACGVAALAKFALLFVGLLLPSLMLPCLWGCLIIGAVISHAPGSVRHAGVLGRPGPCSTPRGAAR